MMKRTPLIFALPLSGALLLSAGCSEDPSYSYFRVDVTLDHAATTYPPYFDRIIACGANVEGSDIDFAPLSCRPGGPDGTQLGTFEWSTTATKGTVRFVVTVKDLAGHEIGRGTSSDVNIVSNGTANASVTVIPDPEALKPRS
jgi:hypothetical protein